MHTPVKLTMEERETMYVVDPVTDTVTAFSTLLHDINELRRLRWEVVAVDYYDDGSICSATFRAPARYLTPRLVAPRTKRTRKPA